MFKKFGMICVLGLLVSSCTNGGVLVDHEKRIIALENLVIGEAILLEDIIAVLPPSISASTPPQYYSKQEPREVEEPKTSSTRSTPKVVGPKTFYAAALDKYYARDYVEARSDFREFVRSYPTNALVPNALYWEGECNYALHNYRDAIFNFKDVQTRFPEHSKTPDALLKTALSYGLLGDGGNKALHVAVLFSDWPDSKAAASARRLGLAP